MCLYARCSFDTQEESRIVRFESLQFRSRAVAPVLEEPRASSSHRELGRFRVTKPSSTMSSSEAQCLGKCTDRYVEATKMISHVVLQAYSKGAGGM